MSDSPTPIRFTGALGSQLAARLDSPPGEPLAFALFAHCFTCSKDTLAASRISAAVLAAWASRYIGAPVPETVIPARLTDAA